MFYFLNYFLKMGDGYVKILSFQYNVSILKYRLIMGTISFVIMMGWTNSILVYIYLPIQLLVFNENCTMEFLEMAQKFLVIGYIQPTAMGLFMLVIILYFAKDEKRRTEAPMEGLVAESSALGSVAPAGKEALYSEINQINQSVFQEEQKRHDNWTQ